MGNDPDMDARRYSIGELAELTGVSRRTVHFYVQRRLIDPPLGRGRGRHYDAGHVRQIREVRALQRLGVPLAAMSEGARPGAVAQPVSSPSPRLNPQDSTHRTATVNAGPALPSIQASVRMVS